MRLLQEFNSVPRELLATDASVFEGREGLILLDAIRVCFGGICLKGQS